MSEQDYEIHIRPLSEEDGGGFLAEVPELPGCMSDGETPQEALENVFDAIRCWIECEGHRKANAAAPLGRAGVGDEGDTKLSLSDEDEPVEWTADVLARAQISVGGKVIRPATGTLTTPFLPLASEKKKSGCR